MSTTNEIAERFARDTGPHGHEELPPYGHLGPCRVVADRPHEMTVLYDDGPYRHLRFKSPDASRYWFELITWPGCLTFRGDVGDDFTFARVPDMFAFFRGHEINPTYWSEKTTATTMTYSEDLFKRSVWEHVRNYGQGHRGLARAVQEHFFDRWSSDWDTSREDQAREALEAFAFTAAGRGEPFGFVDAWEWSFRDFDWSFLWACHAIVWGIARYDAEHAVTTVELATAGAS